MIGLLDTIKTSFSHKLVGHLAARLGEGVAGTNKALANIVPLVLGSIIEKANSGEAQSVFDLSQQAYRAASANLGSVTGMLGVIGRGVATYGSVGPGTNLLVELLDVSGEELAGPISAYAGIKTDSTVALCEMVTAALLALLGQHVACRHLTAEGTAAGLASLRDPVRAMLACNYRSRLRLLWLRRAVQVMSLTEAHPRWLRIVSAVVGGTLLFWVSLACTTLQ